MQGIGFCQRTVGISVFLMGGAFVKFVLLGIGGVIAILVSLVLCGIYAVYSAGGYMTFDDPF